MKMHRIVTLSLFATLCLLLAAVPASADNIYDDGPVDGQDNAWVISYGSAVSDQTSVVNTSRSNIKSNIAVWVSPGDTPLTIGWMLGTSPFGGDIAAGTSNLTIGSSFTNQYGYNVDQVSFSMGTINLDPGTYWLTLENATTANGDPIFWDQNSGPSEAMASGLGTVPSESFTLQSDGGGTTPEPGSMILFGSAVLGIAGLFRRQLGAG